MINLLGTCVDCRPSVWIHIIVHQVRKIWTSAERIHITERVAHHAFCHLSVATGGRKLFIIEWHKTFSSRLYISSLSWEEILLLRIVVSRQHIRVSHLLVKFLLNKTCFNLRNIVLGPVVRDLWKMIECEKNTGNGNLCLTSDRGIKEGI